jgi:hypothetical protein
MPEGAASSWALPDIVIRSKSGFANQEPQSWSSSGPDKRVVTPRRIMTSLPAAIVTAAIAQRTDNELNRAREDCCRPIR